METLPPVNLLPEDPLILQEQIAELQTENAGLLESLIINEQLTQDQGRELQRLRGQLTVWQRTAALQAGVDLVVVREESEKNAKAVVDEFDLNLARGALRVIRTLHTSIISLRESSGTGLRAFVQAKIGQIHAEERASQAEEDAKTARAERDQMMAERNRAVEIVENTSRLRAIYEEGIERSRKEVEEARESDRRALAQMAELGGVHAQNQTLTEENQRLTATKVTDDARITELEAQIKDLTQKQTSPEEGTQTSADMTQDPKYQELAATNARLVGGLAEKDRVAAAKDRQINDLAEAITRLEREKHRLETAVASAKDNLAKAKGKKGGGAGLLSHLFGK